MHTDIAISDPKADPKTIVDQILAIAPVLPGQTKGAAEGQPGQAPPAQFSSGPTAHQVPSATTTDTLIDFDSKASREGGGGALQSKSNSQQPTSSLMDDDHGLNNKLSSLKMQDPISPQPGRPIHRTDTDTNEVDEFVDAEG